MPRTPQSPFDGRAARHDDGSVDDSDCSSSSDGARVASTVAATEAKTDTHPAGRDRSDRARHDRTEPAGPERLDAAERSPLSRRTYLATLAATCIGSAAGTTQSAAQSAVDVAPSEKRGYVGSDPARANALGAGWFYNYMPTQDDLDAFESASFVPMINGDDLGWTSGAADAILESEYDAEYVLGYNEPQHEEGYEEVDEILYPHWQTFSEKFRDTDIAICTPSIKTGTERGRAYFDDFMTAVENDDSLVVDEIAIHWYAGSDQMRDDPESQAQWFLDRIEWIHQNYGNRPIWITEFGGPNFSNTDAEALAQSNITFLESTVPELERRDYVTGYAWWEGGRATRLTEVVDDTVQLTDVGEAYVGISDGSGPTRLTDLPTTETVPEGRYQLESVNSGHVLEVAEGSAEDGADVRQGADADAAHQRWDLQYDGDGRYQLVADHSGAAADVAEASDDPGANVQQWEANEGDHQRWHVDPVGDDQYRIVAAHSGLVLDVSDESTETGASVIQWEWTGGTNQRWQLVPVEEGEAGEAGEEPPALGDEENSPRDLDGDGLYEDGTGDGSTTTNDVVVFFENVEDPAVTEHAEYYDFDDNGQVSITDVIDLFDRL